MSAQPTPGHFATHFLDQAIGPAADPGLAVVKAIEPEYMDFLIKSIQGAAKFFMPETGMILPGKRAKTGELTHQLLYEDADLLHLPYPVTLFEYYVPADGDGYRKDLASEKTSTRRITLAFDFSGPEFLSHPVFSCALKGVDAAIFASEGGIVIVPIWYVDEDRTWTVGSGAAFVPRNQAAATRMPKEFRDMNGQFHDGPRGLDGLLLCAQTIAIVMVKAAALIGAGLEMTSRSLIDEAVRDCSHDIIVVSDFVKAAGCVNISNQAIALTSGEQNLNKKRARSGKAPLFPYHVLNLALPREVSDLQNMTEEERETAKSRPRTHPRRGHPRVIDQGPPRRRVWVHPTIVNQGLTDVIDTDYRVKQTATGRKSKGYAPA